MEKKLFCSNAANAAIKGLSDALKRRGVTEGADVYYFDDRMKYPFFKIPKKYKREKPDDPDVHYAFVDVNGSSINSVDYRVHGSHTHEHLRDADAAADLVAKLLSGAVVEVGIVDCEAAVYFFMNDSGSAEENIAIIKKHKPTIDEYLSDYQHKWGERHTHADFDEVYPFRLYCGMPKYILEGAVTFMLLAKLGEHPTIKVII